MLVYSELGSMSVPTVHLLLLLSNSPPGPQLLLSNIRAGEIVHLLLMLSNSPPGPQLLLSNIPSGEVLVTPPMTIAERKMYKIFVTVDSGQRPPLQGRSVAEATVVQI